MPHAYTVWKVYVKLEKEDSHFTLVFQTLEHEKALQKINNFFENRYDVLVEQAQFTGSLHKAEFDMATLFA